MRVVVEHSAAFDVCVELRATCDHRLLVFPRKGQLALRACSVHGGVEVLLLVRQGVLASAQESKAAQDG